MKGAVSQRITGLAVVLALLPMGAGAQSAGPLPQIELGVAAHRSGTVIGTVWRRDDSPVAHALLRLRNVTSGQVTMAAQADAQGRFTFTGVVAGSYIVELVDQGGNVLALGQMFALGLRETVATFIRLGTEIPWYSGFFSNAAAAALASAASLGVTALGEGVQPASARS